MYCSSEKQIKILQLMMDFYNRALNVIKNGCQLTKINSLSVANEIVRIKMDIPNDEIEKINDVQVHLDEQFRELESVYSKAGAL